METGREGGWRVLQEQVEAWEGLAWGGETSSPCQGARNTGEAGETPIIQGDQSGAGRWGDRAWERGREGMSHFLGQGEGMTHSPAPGWGS